MKTNSKKAMRVLGVVFLVNALLVATHLGEFWPFSIYPMFSQAGNPWTRALLTEIPPSQKDIDWDITGLDDIEGNPIGTKNIGVDQIDFSNFVVKTKEWNRKRLQALRFMLGEGELETKNLLVYKVNGKLSEQDQVEITYTPFIYFTKDSTYYNPKLDSAAYFSQ
ncbi:hypothetical protein [Gracilimonas halophila]|uniref:Uncharacterized protein n=1 Tax=Gracilimonas halophila TaxID=1834464 RepID=A0ABW5JLU7_9BACT